MVTGDSGFAQGDANRPGKCDQFVDVFQNQIHLVMSHQKEPVASPCHVAAHFAIARDFDSNVGCPAVTGDIVHRDFAFIMQNGRDNADWSLDAVLARSDAVHISERRDQSDGSVATHSQVTHIIEKDDARNTGTVHGFAQQGTHNYVRSSGLIHHRRAERVMLLPESLQSVGQRVLTKIWRAADDNSGGLSARVRVDYLYSLPAVDARHLVVLHFNMHKFRIDSLTRSTNHFRCLLTIRGRSTVIPVFSLAEAAHYRDGVRLGDIKRAFALTRQDLNRHHTLQVAASLSYYFVLSVFPGLIFLSAVLGLLPLGDLFNRILVFMSRLLPQDTMRIVQTVLHEVLSSHRGTWLSFGMLGIIWTASSGFAALIEALDIAYDAEDDRPYWRVRLLSIGLAAICGGLLLVALGVMIVGPRFGEWLAVHLGLSTVFATIWPALRWTIAISFTVLAVELIYFLAPNAKQRFGATLPGAIFSVIIWLGLSDLLGLYFAHFANLSKIYGTLAGFIAFMTWLYWNSFALLLGAELNAELAKQSRRGLIRPRGESQEEQSQESIFRRAA